MAIHAMIDIETLATDPNATILTIGGVKFNPYNDVEPHSAVSYTHLTLPTNREL